MDNTLNLKIEEFKKALSILDKALREEKSEIARDSTIKRFKYTYELGWKTSKVF